MTLLQVGVKAFLKNSEGKYLLLKRNSEKYKNTKGSWDIVGGRIEPGTSLFMNLRREVKEETGLEIISEPRLIAAQDIMPSEDRHIVRLSYIAECAGNLKLDLSESIEHQWLDLKGLKEQQDLDIYVQEIVAKNLIS